MPRALLALLLALTLPGAAVAAAAGKAADTEAELRRITERLNDLDKWLGSADRKRAQWQRDIQASDRAVARLSREVETTAAALAGTRAELAELREEQARLERERQRQARRIGEHLAAAHRMSGEDVLKLLLNQQSPAAFERMIRYHRHFSAARLESLEEYRSLQDRLTANREALQSRVAAAEARQRDLQREQQRLLEQRREREALLVRLAAESEDKAAERERLAADQSRLESLLSELKRRSRSLDGRAFAERKGGLPWPLQGRVRQAFGQPRAAGRLVWNGIVVGADAGTPVKAVFRGRVVFADWLRGFGLLTIVDHGSGYMTLYGHADTLLKEVGDWVEAGEVIARAGRSGGQEQPGLYFEVRQNGRARDPVSWLARR